METNRRITQILDLENTYLKVAIITIITTSRNKNILIIEEQIENLSRKIEIIKQNGTARTKKCNILNKNVLEILSAD